MTTLGVNCTSSFAFLSVADGDDVVLRGPERLAFPAGLGLGEQLAAFADDASRALRDIAPTRVVLLQASGTYEAGHMAWTDRIAMETLIRFEASRAGIDARYLSQQAVRGAFLLKGKGSLGQLGEGMVAPAGRYWKTGRLTAALAAIAAERKS